MNSLQIGLSLPDISGLIIMAGAVLFFIAAFMPVSRVYARSEQQVRQEMVRGAPAAWRLSQVLFGLGAVVAVAGAAYTTYLLRAIPASLALWIGVAALALGCLPWLVIVYRRAADPQAFIEGRMPKWLFQVYSLLTQFGLGMFGAGVLGSPLQAWLGYALIGGAVLFFALFIIFRDLPPFVYYLLFFLAGLMIFMAV